MKKIKIFFINILTKINEKYMLIMYGIIFFCPLVIFTIAVIVS